MAEKDYIVTRQHQGERFYFPGETRRLEELDASNLVNLGSLAEPGSDAAKAAIAAGDPLERIKANAPHENKAEEAPKNKATRAPRNKSAGD